MRITLLAIPSKNSLLEKTLPDIGDPVPQKKICPWHFPLSKMIKFDEFFNDTPTIKHPKSSKIWGYFYLCGSMSSILVVGGVAKKVEISRDFCKELLDKIETMPVLAFCCGFVRWTIL